jgi:hypothetical protein
VQDEAIELEIKVDRSYPSLSRFLVGFEVMLCKNRVLRSVLSAYRREVEDLAASTMLPLFLCGTNNSMASIICYYAVSHAARENHGS